MSHSPPIFPDLAGKSVLITGGASGIGRAAALAFAQAGGRVVIADVDEAGGVETAAQINQTGGEAIFVLADVSQSDQVKNMVAHAVQAYGRLDCAFNNAGFEGRLARTADVTEADFDRIIAVNLKGVWLCLKHELNQMLRQGSGVIVNTASVAGLVGAHSMSAYGASKHGVVGLTRAAAVEYADKEIRVNAVCPSVIDTPMARRGFAQFPQFRQNVEAANPSRRLGQPEEVVTAVLWLCSAASSFVTGAALPVDGGFTAQ